MTAFLNISGAPASILIEQETLNPNHLDRFMANQARWLLKRSSILRLGRAVVIAIVLSCMLQVRVGRTSELLDALAANDLSLSGRLTLIDVRTASERAAHGTPIKSIWIEWKGMEQSSAFIEALKVAQPDPAAPVAFICSVGHRSGQAARLAGREGYRQAFDIAEGVNGSAIGPGWKLWGLPLEIGR